MNDPLDSLREQLAGTPREREYIDFGGQGLSDSQRAQARDLLVAAAMSGDPRAPAVLGHLETGEALQRTLADLLARAPVRVRVEAADQLRARLRADMQGALGGAIRDGQLDSHGLQRAIALLLAEGAEPFVLWLLDDTPHEHVRTALIEGLWQARGLHLYPAVWWSGLGLMRRTLGLPARSFRTAELIERFKRLLATNPSLSGFQPATQTTIPPALKTAMDDLKKGQGALADAAVQALADEERQAFLVYAASQALESSRPRAVLYVAYLGGAAHRDVLEWAASQRLDALRAAGVEALRMIAGG